MNVCEKMTHESGAGKVTFHFHDETMATWFFHEILEIKRQLVHSGLIEIGLSTTRGFSYYYVPIAGNVEVSKLLTVNHTKYLKGCSVCDGRPFFKWLGVGV